MLLGNLVGNFPGITFIMFLLGPVEFTATSDYKSNKPVAIRVRPLPAGSVEIDTLCDKPVTGTVESEARPSSSGLPSDQGLGTVSYDRNGVCLLANIMLNASYAMQKGCLVF